MAEPKNGLLAQASLKWDNLNRVTWEKSGSKFILGGTINIFSRFIIYLDDLLRRGASEAATLPLDLARHNKWNAH